MNCEKKVKVGLTAVFFVNTYEQEVDEPVKIWKNKNPRCFHVMQKVLAIADR